MSGIWQHLSRRGRLPLLMTFVVLWRWSSPRRAPTQGRRSSSSRLRFIRTPLWARPWLVDGDDPELRQRLGRSLHGVEHHQPGDDPIAVPAVFRPITSVTASSPTGQTTRNWTVSYDSGTGTINGFAKQGTDKLMPGETITDHVQRDAVRLYRRGDIHNVGMGLDPDPRIRPVHAPDLAARHHHLRVRPTGRGDGYRPQRPDRDGRRRLRRAPHRDFRRQPQLQWRCSI